MKNCPFCAEDIESGLSQCPFCASDLAAHNRWIRFLGLFSVLGLLLLGAYEISLAFQPQCLGNKLIHRLGWASFWTCAALYLATTFSFKSRKRWGRVLWLVTLALVVIGAVYVRCWKEMKHYQLQCETLLSSLVSVQERAKQSAKISSDMETLQGDWDRFSREHSSSFCSLPSYQRTEEAVKDLVRGQTGYKNSLLKRWDELATDISAMKKSTQFGPEAGVIYKSELKKAQKFAAAQVSAAKRKLAKAIAESQVGQRKLQQAQQLVNNARQRVDRSYNNSTKALYGEGNVFSAEFNSNRDPGSAYDYLEKCQEILYKVSDANEQLQAKVEAAQSELTEVEQSGREKAQEKAEHARQRVQDQIDRLRFVQKQKELNNKYREWYQTQEAKRLAALASSENHLNEAQEALRLESPWQLAR